MPDASLIHPQSTPNPTRGVRSGVGSTIRQDLNYLTDLHGVTPLANARILGL